jgi:hypothetical protein
MITQGPDIGQNSLNNIEAQNVHCTRTGFNRMLWRARVWQEGQTLAMMKPFNAGKKNAGLRSRTVCFLKHMLSDA